MNGERHYSRALVLYEQGNFDQALKVFLLALADDPNGAEPACMIACCYERLEKFDDALHWSNQAVSLDPGNSLAYHVLGRSLYCKQRHFSKEVIEAFYNSIKHDPEDTQNFSYLSTAYSAARQWKMALQWAQKGLQINPVHARCMALEGWSLFHLGEIAKAENQLKESLRIDPNAAATHRYLAHLEVIKGDMAQASEHIVAAHRINPSPVVEFDQYQAGYAFTSHDLMCEIVKAEGTLYGKVLCISTRVNHAWLVQEAKPGKMYPLFVGAIVLIGLMFMMAMKGLMSGLPYAVSNTIAGILVCTFFLVVAVIPPLSMAS
jgi:Flp pilus assembly protein TadD